MAFKIAAVFVLSVLVCSSFALPVSQDVKTVQLSNSENEYTEKTPVLNTETISNFETEVKLVQSLSTEILLNAFERIEADHGKRVKRDFMKQGFCAEGWIQVGNGCVTKKEYDDYNDIGESSDD